MRYPLSICSGMRYPLSICSGMRYPLSICSGMRYPLSICSGMSTFYFDRLNEGFSSNSKQTTNITIKSKFHEIFHFICQRLADQYEEKCVPVYDIKRVSMCNIMVEGFRFRPLGLVRLRTFRLSTWVS